MTRPYAVFSSHALLPSSFRGSSLSARISEVRRRFSNNLHNFCCAHILPLIRRTGAMLVAIGIALHATLLTEDQRGTRGIALCRLPLFVASHQAMATSTLSAGVSWVDPTGEKTFAVGLVLRVLEDASLHPEGPFAIASSAVLALLWLEMAQVLKYQDRRAVLFGKLHNASTHQMRDGLVHVVDLAPEVGIVLFAFCYRASLASVVCDPS